MRAALISRSLPAPRLGIAARCALALALAGVLLGIGTLGAGCAVQNIQHGPKLDGSARWTQLPIINHTEVPHAGERVEAVLGTLLRVRGVRELAAYTLPSDDASLPDLDDRRRLEVALSRARQAGFLYGVTGSVEEWRYRSGIDGEPAVGLTVQVLDVATGKVLWSGSGSRSGWGREVLTGTAQKLMASMLDEMDL